MSEENAETARQAIDAANRDDRAAWLALHDQDCEVVPSRFWPEPEVIRGREAAWEFYSNFTRTLEGFADPIVVGDAEIVDAGADKLLIHLRHPMGSGLSEAGVEASSWNVVTFREGRIVREEWFLDRAEALEAAGLSE
jgi:ketosteroid isomerase-like protein